ncbi:CBS domain-containing protein [Salinimicrobium catena]|uniref:CBS domain-containing protein n=1 Tax=Salinimicrobium catena TaxID=390640 RepID=A0A1H5L716_9FLAO|nr:CBS domain-containing protein [Salinimicrobium catena]SDL06520.1 CBS domain-containing protein [Salinimicrobium catena]SEE72866.1 CBS domain-containing protein [Salinimicrobium catena]
MKKNAPVSAIMTRNIVKLKLSDELSTAESLFKRNHIRHLPVVENGHIVGMLSYTDLLRISFADAVDEDGEGIETTVYDMFSIEQVMTKKVVSVDPDTTIEQVGNIFLSHEFHALPVVADDRLVGIVTTTDVIRCFLKEDC